MKSHAFLLAILPLLPLNTYCMERGKTTIVSVTPIEPLPAWREPSAYQIMAFSIDLASFCRNPSLSPGLAMVPGESKLAKILPSILEHKKEAGTLHSLLIRMKQLEGLPKGVMCPAHLIEKHPCKRKFLSKEEMELVIDDIDLTLIPPQDLFFIVNSLLIEGYDHIRDDVIKKHTCISKLKLSLIASILIGITSLCITLSQCS